MTLFSHYSLSAFEPIKLFIRDTNNCTFDVYKFGLVSPHMFRSHAILSALYTHI